MLPTFRCDSRPPTLSALYRMHPILPSLGLALAVAACDRTPPPPPTVEKVPNVYLEALQDAEALRHTIEERNLEQQRFDALLGDDTNGTGQPTND